jgi:hypothetical protein
LHGMDLVLNYGDIVFLAYLVNIFLKKYTWEKRSIILKERKDTAVFASHNEWVKNKIKININ